MLDSGKTPPNLRMLHIFNVIADHDNMMTATELTEKLGWPKQSVHRLVSLLRHEGYLEKQGRFLVPSKKMMGIANGLLQNRAIFNLRHQVLNEVSEMTGETVNLVLPEEDGALCRSCGYELAFPHFIAHRDACAVSLHGKR